MKKLWAPWRKGYILRKQTRSCFICQIHKSKLDRKHFIIERSLHSLSVLNLYPYNNGHVMVVPARHVKDLKDLNDRELLDLIQLMNRTIDLLRLRLNAQGINVGINLGRISGAGVPGHVHIHLVPRWSGDTNFMPVIAETKVIGESIQSVYRRLKTNKK